MESTTSTSVPRVDLLRRVEETVGEYMKRFCKSGFDHSTYCVEKFVFDLIFVHSGALAFILVECSLDVSIL